MIDDVELVSGSATPTGSSRTPRENPIGNKFRLLGVVTEGRLEKTIRDQTPGLESMGDRLIKVSSGIEGLPSFFLDADLIQ